MAILLCVFTIATASVYYVTEQHSYLENMKMANENMVRQIGVTYEMIIRYIKDSIIKTILYENDAFMLSMDERNTYDGKMDILNSLTSLSAMSEFIHSAYLYFPDSETVYSSYGAPGTVTPFNLFWDQEVFSQMAEEGNYTLNPRLLPIQSNALDINNLPLVISMVVSVPLGDTQCTSCLAVNINAGNIYSSVFRYLQLSQEVVFFIYDDDSIIYHKDRTKIFSTLKEAVYDEADSSHIVSVYASSFLNWNFVVETAIQPSQSAPLHFIKLITAILMLLLIGGIVLVQRSTLPFKRMARDAREMRWKDFLTAKGTPSLEQYPLLGADLALKECEQYAAVTVMQWDGEMRANACQEWLVQAMNSAIADEKIVYRMISLNHQSLCLIIGFTQKKDPATCEKELQLLCNHFLDHSNNDLSNELCCAISTLKETVDQIHEAYKETLTVSNYHYAFDSPVMLYSQIRENGEPYEYPVEAERQLINNLVIGNNEACFLFCQRILQSFSKAPYTLDDTEINKNIYLLQSDILRHLMSLPMPLKIDADIKYEDCRSMRELQAKMERFLQDILEKVNAKDHDGRLVLYSAIIDYIDRNYANSDFGLAQMADSFNLNRNYVGQIVKEITGRSFSEHLTDKRIHKSKELLENESFTVNEIAAQVGFSYSYYFIRKFKQMEGITPGQYRESCRRPQ